MQFKTIAYALLIAGTAAIVAVGTASPSFAAKKKAKAPRRGLADVPPAAKGGLRTRDGHAEDLCERLLCAQGWRDRRRECACGAKKMSMKKHGKKSKK